MERIKVASQKAVEGKCQYLEIYYTGHGERGTGDWLAAIPDICMNGSKDYLVSLNEVLDKIIEAGFT